MILQPCNVELTKIHYYDKTKRGGNLEISTISREVCENNFNRNVIIKKNVFGHRWVLKINENEDDAKKNSKLKVVIYVLVFCSIIVAVCFGIFFSIDNRNKRRRCKRNKLKSKWNNSKTVKNKDKNIFKTTDHTVIEVIPLNNNSENTYSYRTHENQILETAENKPNEEHRTTTTTTTTEQGNISSSIIQTAIMCSQCSPSQEVCLKLRETEEPKCVKILDKNDPTGCGGLCQINTHFCQILDLKHKIYQCSPLTNTLQCPNGTFNCGNRCISEEKRCDGVVHCSNRSDEENCACNLESHFHCGKSTSCLAKSKKCDGKVDCWDKSDEIYCWKASNCTTGEIPCYNGQCIPRNHFCDRKFDCVDKSDEPEECRT